MIDIALRDSYLRIQHACMAHAHRCRKCCVSIMDTEGNPGCASEACPRGIELLTEYREIEAKLMALPPGSITAMFTLEQDFNARR